MTHERSRTRPTSWLLTGLALGAGAMYLFDPDRGRSRRAVLADRGRGGLRSLEDLTRKAGRDASHRAHGTRARLRAAFGREPPDDHVLEARVRSCLGRAVSHPHAIDIDVHDRRVTLRGPVLTHEVDHLLHEVRKVRGVMVVHDALERHDDPGRIPSLQGEPAQRGIARSPARRLATGAAGAALAAWGVGRGGLLGLPVGVAGLAMIAGAATPMMAPRLTGGRRLVRVQKTITIHAPVEEVFGFFSHFENFPRFMEHVAEVTTGADGRTHWKVTGPGSIPVEFDAETIAHVPNEKIEWRSVPGSLVKHEGTVRFEPVEGGTRLHVQMGYRPPGGPLTHAAAAFLGGDPRHLMDDDLLRLKSLLEVGKATARGHEVRLDELH